MSDKYQILSARVRMQPNEYGGERSLVVEADHVMSGEAKFACDLVERWGMVAGQPDGEDSAGRAKIRLATAEELVDRAVDVTAKLFQRFKDDGWLIEVAYPPAEVVSKTA
jgi:hypothetical protein